MSKTLAAAVALLAATGLFTACGSGAKSGSSPSSTVSAAASSSTPASSSPAAADAPIKTATGPLGTYLVDKAGKAIYILTSDKPGGPSACPVGPCLTAWPPVPAPAPLPSAVTGVSATFGTFAAANGVSQLTINGYPVYYFVQDSAAGMTAGQGKVSFGGTWWLLAPSGSWITGAAGASASTGTSSGGYGY